MRRRLVRALGLLALLALAGCTTPTAAGVEIPTYSPRREALAYFPATAPVVAFVSTDPQDPAVRRLASSGALRPLRRLAERHGVFFQQLLGLLGNDAAIGLPHAGGPPLAVLTTRDDGYALDVFARARVVEHRAAPAGNYRGTDLYAEKGWAFGVRDRVLLVGASVPELISALDTRVSDQSFDPAQMTAVLPRTPVPDAFAHGYVDVRALLDRAGPVLRAVPLARALDGAGFVLAASATTLSGRLEAPSQGITPLDLPLGRTRLRVAQPPRSLAVADLGRAATAAERALRAALPVTALRVDALRERLRAAGVALTPELLAGPAALVPGPALRLEPRRPAAVAAALDRASHGVLRREGRFFVLGGVRVAVIDGVLVAGRLPAPRLLALARARRQPLTAPAALALPRLGRLYDRPLRLTLGGTLRRLRLSLSSPLG